MMIRGAKITRCIAFVWALKLLLTPAWAQVVNVQPLFGTPDDDGFHAEARAGGSYLTGNVPFLTFQGDLLLRYLKDKNVLLSSTNVGFGRGGGSPFLNRQTSHLRYQRILTDVSTWEAYTQITHDQVWRLNVRALAGTGMRFRAVESEKVRVFFGVGYLFEFEQLSRIEDVQDSGLKRFNHRLGHYSSLSYRPKDYLTWTLIGYFQPRFDAPTDFRVFGLTSMAVKIEEWLAVAVSFQLQYNSWTPETIRPLDTTTTYQLTVSM
jgi:hypothetical protein